MQHPPAYLNPSPTQKEKKMLEISVHFKIRESTEIYIKISNSLNLVSSA